MKNANSPRASFLPQQMITPQIRVLQIRGATIKPCCFKSAMGREGLHKASQCESSQTHRVSVQQTGLELLQMSQQPLHGPHHAPVS